MEETEGGAAMAHGYRLRVSATSLWFDIAPERWRHIRDAVTLAGAEPAAGGLDGEEICSAPGLLISYRDTERRMQTELGPDAATAAARILASLYATAPRAAASASPVWLWAPEPFALDGVPAEPALRIMRAGRWLLPLPRAADAFSAAATAHAALGSGAVVRMELHSQVELEVTVAAQTAAQAPAAPRLEAFTHLLARLGTPTWAEYSTHSPGTAAPGAEHR